MGRVSCGGSISSQHSNQDVVQVPTHLPVLLPLPLHASLTIRDPRGPSLHSILRPQRLHGVAQGVALESGAEAHGDVPVVHAVLAVRVAEGHLAIRYELREPLRFRLETAYWPSPFWEGLPTGLDGKGQCQHSHIRNQGPLAPTPGTPPWSLPGKRTVSFQTDPCHPSPSFAILVFRPFRPFHPFRPRLAVLFPDLVEGRDLARALAGLLVRRSASDTEAQGSTRKHKEAQSCACRCAPLPAHGQAAVVGCEGQAAVARAVFLKRIAWRPTTEFLKPAELRRSRTPCTHHASDSTIQAVA